VNKKRTIKPHTRTLPKSIDAEQSVLGGLMLSGNTLHEVSDILSESDFFTRAHQIIYQAIRAQDAEKKPYDAVTVAEWCEANGYADMVSGGAYITEITAATPSAANIRAYAELVRDRSRKRQLIDTCQTIIDGGMHPNSECSEILIAAAAAQVADLARHERKGKGLVMAKSGINHAWEDIAARQMGTLNGIKPQWSTVQAHIPILENKELLVLAARPGMGKTANAMQWALHAAQAGKNVAVFSLEMGMNQLLTRALAHFSRIPQQRLRQANGIEEEEWSRLHEAVRIIKNLPIGVDDSGGLTVEDIRARCLRMHANAPGGLGLVVVDYLQLVKPTERKSFNNKNDEVAHISRELKRLAHELDCPVIAAAQLNRQVENRANKTPTLADLRDSGAIEQDADIIAFLYRHNYYQTPNDAVGQEQNACEFIVAKNRNGQTGVAMLRHRLECSTFEDGDGLERYTPPQENSCLDKKYRTHSKTWNSSRDYRARQSLQ